MNENIHIPNPKELKKKIDRVKKDGFSRLHILSDFDSTLTKCFKDGRMIGSTFAHLREGDYLPAEYTRKSRQLYAKYRPIEISESISPKEKNKKMVEWWNDHLKLMIKYGVTKKIMKDVVLKEKAIPRKGLFGFLDVVNKNNIPLLILSAGIGNIIEEFLRFHKKLYKNTHIIANFFLYDEKGRVTGYNNKIIHSHNKNETQIKNTPYFKEVKKRKNVILLGDLIADIDMASGLDHDVIIKIGFLNEKKEELLEKFSKAFDVVILNDGEMEYVNDLMEELAA